MFHRVTSQTSQMGMEVDTPSQEYNKYILTDPDNDTKQNVAHRGSKANRFDVKPRKRDEGSNTNGTYRGNNRGNFRGRGDNRGRGRGRGNFRGHDGGGNSRGRGSHCRDNNYNDSKPLKRKSDTFQPQTDSAPPMKFMKPE